MASLPNEVSYGTVTGRIITAVGDTSSDPDLNPDSYNAVGLVTFTPTSLLISQLSNVVILPQPITVSLDSSGAFSVTLVATNDPDLSPANWTYSVFFNVSDGAIAPLSIYVPSNTSQDISDLILSGPAIPTAQIPSLVSRVTALESGGTGGSSAVSSVAGRTGAVVLTSTDVGLGNVNNTSDLAKPISTATNTALSGKEASITAGTTLQYWRGDKAWTTLDKSSVGLNNVDNTADTAKPVSTAQQTALNLKANLASPTFTGTVSGITATMVGLGSVNNTSDTAKPVSTAQQTALNAKADLVGGTIPTSQMPSISITDFLGSVASQTAMLALVGQKGDWAIRTDTSTTWVITGADPSVIGGWTALAAPSSNGAVTSVNSQTGVVVLGKTDVGLGNVDNTSDVAKPVSTAQQTALNLKANLASPTFTGTVAGITSAMVGLGSVNNTSDAAKPVSTAQQTALDLKAPLASPAFTGTPTGITKTHVGLGNVDNTSDVNKPVSTATSTALAAKADLVAGVLPTSQLPSLAVTDFLGTVASQAAMLALVGQKGDWAIRSDLGTTWVITGTDPTVIAGWTALSYPAGGGSVSSVNSQTGAVVLGKTDVGLGNVDNTSDVSKPVSTAQQTALNLKAPLASPAFTGTPTGITSAHVGLGNVNNTSDASKPVSTAQQTALNLKADLASPTFTGTVAGISKSMVGLANVDNTSDASKPVSTAQQTALDAKASSVHTHVALDITNSTTVGRNVLTAADALSARTAIGAGTSSLALGTTLTTAKAGNYTPSIADLPANSVLFTSTTTRPTARTDVCVFFTGSTDPGAAALDGDVWIRP